MTGQALGTGEMRGLIPWSGTTFALQALLTMQPPCKRKTRGLIPRWGSNLLCKL
jgi:hypothetical protein